MSATSLLPMPVIGPRPAIADGRSRAARRTVRARSAAFGTCEVRLASDPATRDDAYALRYRSYRASGHVAERADERFSDRYDLLPTSRTMVAYRDGIAMGSVRACLIAHEGGWQAPCLDAFPSETARLMAQVPRAGGRIAAIEVNRLVCDPAAPDGCALVFLLYRLAGMFAVRHDAAMALSCVRRHHVPFYRRLRFVEAGEARAYPGLSCPMRLMACARADYDATRRSLPAMDPGRSGSEACEGLIEGRTLTMRLHPARAAA